MTVVCSRRLNSERLFEQAVLLSISFQLFGCLLLQTVGATLFLLGLVREQPNLKVSPAKNRLPIGIPCGEICNTSASLWAQTRIRRWDYHSDHLEPCRNPGPAPGFPIGLLDRCRSSRPAAGLPVAHRETGRFPKLTMSCRPSLSQRPDNRHHLHSESLSRKPVRARWKNSRKNDT